MGSQVNKPYNVDLCQLDTFFVPHNEANHLNAQDIVSALVSQAKTLANIGSMLENEGSGYTCSDEIISNLFWDISTKLAVIEKTLSKSFKDE